MIHELLEKRYSPRSFENKKIDDEVLLELLEAARWSPSSMNEQPWRFVVGIKDEGNTYNKIYDTLMEGNKSWAANAPVLILAIAADFYEGNGRPNNHAEYDLGQAVAHLTFQATAKNIYLHQMGGFSAEKAKENFNIPGGYKPVTVIALGYKGSIERLPENLRKREQASRIRKNLSEIIFEGNFGEKSDLIKKRDLFLN